MKLGKNSKRQKRRNEKARHQDRRRRNLARVLSLGAVPGTNEELGT